MSNPSISKSPLHICFVVYDYHDNSSSPENHLQIYNNIVDWCESLSKQVTKMSVVLRFKQDAFLQKNNIDYFFVKDKFNAQLTFWQIPKKIHRKVVAQHADIVHGHNFNKVLQHWDLNRRLRSTNTPLILQNHAETPRFWIRNIIQKWAFSQIGGFIFCATGQEKIWYDKSIFFQNTRVYYVMEGSTYFKKIDRQVARSQTGLTGNPILLWVGNLNHNKDPLTVLQAFAQILLEFPDAKLYMIFRTQELLQQVEEYIQNNLQLQKAVALLGAKQQRELEYFYNSADYFILGSHQEGSGYSAMEAIACGCVPILTDIPSYRMMTNQGRIGSLWSPGNSSSLVAAIRKAFSLSVEEQSKMGRFFFEEQLSYDSIAKTMVRFYAELVKVYRSS